MPAFVNGRRDHDDREQNQEEERLIQQRPDALTDPVHEEQPAVEGNEPDQRRRHHQRPEEGPEDRGDRIHQSRRYHRRPKIQAEQGVRALQFRAGSVGCGQDADWAEFGVGEHPDVIGADPASEIIAHRPGNLVVIPAAIRLRGDEVEQAG